jgi:hypothetical protein
MIEVAQQTARGRILLSLGVTTRSAQGAPPHGQYNEREFTSMSFLCLFNFIQMAK